MATLERVLLLVLIHLSSSQAFLPNLDGSALTALEDTKTHESITRKGVLNMTVTVFQDLAQQKGRVLDVSSLKGDLVEEEIFKLYYGAPVSTKRFKMALDEIIRSNNEVDFLFPNDAKSHSEAEKFKEAKLLIINKKKQTIANIIKENYTAARVSLGGLLHTLQDFYSHSNWVELGNVKTTKGMTMHNEILGEIAGQTEKTCGPCTSSQGCNPILSSILEKRKLTSSYPHSTVPDGKCAHGGGGTNPPTRGINKDTMSPALSPQYHLHQEAAELAFLATLEVLQDIRESVSEPLFVKFLDLEPPSTISFVIDMTGSMSEDIEAAKARVFSIIEDKEGMLDDPSLYVLVPFNDSDVGPALITDNANKFKHAIEQLTANGGGDTPKMCLSGVQLALLGSPPGTEIYVFTDAVAKDYELKNRVLALCRETKSKVTFLLTDAFSRRERRSAGIVQPIRSRSDDASGCRLSSDSRGGLRSRSCELASNSRPRGRRENPELQRTSLMTLEHRRGARLHRSYISAEHLRREHLRTLHSGPEPRHHVGGHSSHYGLEHRSRPLHHSADTYEVHSHRFRRQSSHSRAGAGHRSRADLDSSRRPTGHSSHSGTRSSSRSAGHSSRSAGHSSRSTGHSSRSTGHQSRSNTGHQSRTRREATKPGLSLYQDIALASGGYYISSSKTELASVTKIIEDSLSFSMVTLLQVRKTTPTKELTFTFSIDNAVTNVLLYITGKPQYKLSNPAGVMYTGVSSPSPIAESQSAGSLERIRLTSPVQLGKWKLVLTSELEFSLRVRGNSLVDLTYDFVEEVHGRHPGWKKIPGHPLAGASAKVIVHVTGLKSFPFVMPKELYFTDIQGTILQKIPLNGTASPNIFQVSSSSLPKQPFLVTIRGEDGVGNLLQRVSNSLNTISSARVELLSNLSSLYPGENYCIPFLVKNSGIAADFNIIVEGDKRIISGYSPQSIGLATDQGMNGTVKLMVPASIEPGTLLTLTVQCESADKTDFNYAFLQLPVLQKEQRSPLI